MNEEYRKYLEDLDKILNSIKNSNNYESLCAVMGKNNIRPSDRETEFKIAKKLENDGYVKSSIDSVSVNIEITSWGLEFISRGGYISHLNQEIERDKQEKELTESTIRSNQTNIKYFRWNLAFAILNIFLFTVNLIIAYFTLIKPD